MLNKEDIQQFDNIANNMGYTSNELLDLCIQQFTIWGKLPFAVYTVGENNIELFDFAKYPFLVNIHPLKRKQILAISQLPDVPHIIKDIIVFGKATKLTCEKEDLTKICFVIKNTFAKENNIYPEIYAWEKKHHKDFQFIQHSIMSEEKYNNLNNDNPITNGVNIYG